jgi:hypothetical protein
MCVAKEEAEDFLHEKVIFSYFMFFLNISLYGATTNCSTLRNAEFNASADFLVMFHGDMNRRIFCTINSPDRSNSPVYENSSSLRSTLSTQRKHESNRYF